MEVFNAPSRHFIYNFALKIAKILTSNIGFMPIY